MNSGIFKSSPDFPFSFPSYEDWLEVARQELEGANPNEKLSLKKGNLEIRPFYTPDQKEKSSHSLLKASSNPYYGARGWVNTPKILVSDEKKANEIAVSYLNSGADGVLFDCQTTDINPIILLNKISLTDCSVSFMINEASTKWINDFRLYAESNFNKRGIRGCVFWRSIPENFTDAIQSFVPWSLFYPIGIMVEQHEDAGDEIAQALNKAVQLIDAISEKNIGAQIMLDQISFSIAGGTDFFLDIAKIKSLRSLWCQVRGAYNIKNARPLHIHATSTMWLKDSFQPHGNMIKSTTSAMAAIAGGCDSLTVEPEDHNNETMSRIARNVSSILREESHFSKVADPTTGSYYIDSLIDQLSEKAWSKFQSMMK
jgi:methylmalonyl-CoA mutase